MRLIVQSIPVEISLQTVSLALDRYNPHNSHLFRCYHCGTPVARVAGTVVSITAGLLPSNLVVVINQCYKCKESYTFQTVSMHSDVTSLILSPEPERTVSTFHCFICRTALVQYNPDLDTPFVALLPTLNKIETPTAFDCFKEDCKKHYLLREVVHL